jgi:hypothetical protein
LWDHPPADVVVICTTSDSAVSFNQALPGDMVWFIGVFMVNKPRYLFYPVYSY